MKRKRHEIAGASDFYLYSRSLSTSIQQTQPQIDAWITRDKVRIGSGSLVSSGCLRDLD